MKYLIFLFLSIIVFPILAYAKSDNPRATLFMKDGSVVHGYLRVSLHDVSKDFKISETENGKKQPYNNEDIDSLKVQYADGQEAVYYPFQFAPEPNKKINKDTYLALISFDSEHVKGYCMPASYIRSSSPVPSNNFQSYSSKTAAWWYCFEVKDTDKPIVVFWMYIPSKKPSKYNMKDLKKALSIYPGVYETICSRGLTAEQINENPLMVLEILEESLQ